MTTKTTKKTTTKRGANARGALVIAAKKGGDRLSPELKAFLSDLRSDCINVTPIDCQWDDIAAGEDSFFWQAEKCEKCEAVLVLQGGGNEQHSDLDPDTECDGYVSSAEGPMMSYYYPLDVNRLTFDPEEAAKKIADLPLCVVEVDGQFGLALTGGGMDLSWEICAAFIALGFLPPTHFRLPRMASEGLTETRKRTIAAMRRALTLRRNWADADLAELDTVEAWYAADEQVRS